MDFLDSVGRQLHFFIVRKRSFTKTWPLEQKGWWEAIEQVNDEFTVHKGFKSVLAACAECPRLCDLYSQKVKQYENKTIVPLSLWREWLRWVLETTTRKEEWMSETLSERFLEHSLTGKEWHVWRCTIKPLLAWKTYSMQQSVLQYQQILCTPPHSYKWEAICMPSCWLQHGVQPKRQHG